MGVAAGRILFDQFLPCGDVCINAVEPLTIKSSRTVQTVMFARDNLQNVPDGSITPTTPTSVRFRYRTICPGPGADTFVPADISRE